MHASKYMYIHHNVATVILDVGFPVIFAIRSPSEHLLTPALSPALSPFGGPRPKPRRPEEVVYSPNDSYSHFTQRVFSLHTFLSNLQ